jgi:hypothetical protein
MRVGRCFSLTCRSVRVRVCVGIPNVCVCACMRARALDGSFFRSFHLVGARSACVCERVSVRVSERVFLSERACACVSACVWTLSVPVSVPVPVAVCLCVPVHACVHKFHCVCARVHACVRECVRACACVCFCVRARKIYVFMDACIGRYFCLTCRFVRVRVCVRIQMCVCVRARALDGSSFRPSHLVGSRSSYAWRVCVRACERASVQVS